MNTDLSRRARGALARLLVALLGCACGGERFEAEGPEGGATGGGTVGKGGGAAASGGGAAASGGSAGRGSGGQASGGSAGATNGGAGVAGIAGKAGASGASGSGGVSGLGPAIRDGLALWLAADRGVTQIEGDVAKWADSSGNGMDATQSAGDDRPRLVSAGGELPMVEFDGVDDELSLADGFDDFQAGLSFFAVVEVAGFPEECSSMLHLSNGTEIEDIDFSIASTSIAYEVDGHYFRSPEAFDLGQRIIVGVIHRASSDGIAELRVNGTYLNAEEPGVPAAVIRYDNFIGRSLYEACDPFNGRIGEILLYRRALAGAERVEVEDYLKSRWQPSSDPLD